MAGRIVGVTDYGTVVLVHLSRESSELVDAITFDHQMWRRFCESLADEYGNVDLRYKLFELRPRREGPGERGQYLRYVGEEIEFVAKEQMAAKAKPKAGTKAGRKAHR